MIPYKKGQIIKGTITGIEKYGAFVSLDEYYTGLIHISEISHGFVRDINDFVNELISFTLLFENASESKDIFEIGEMSFILLLLTFKFLSFVKFLKIPISAVSFPEIFNIFKFVNSFISCISEIPVLDIFNSSNERITPTFFILSNVLFEMFKYVRG